MKHIYALLLWVVFGTAFAQAITWPPKLETGQVWNFAIEFSGQRYA